MVEIQLTSWKSQLVKENTWFFSAKVHIKLRDV